MKSNLGPKDKIIRVLIALAIAGLYFTGTVSETSGIILIVIGAVLLLTSLVNFCPLYAISGITTKNKK